MIVALLSAAIAGWLVAVGASQIPFALSYQTLRPFELDWRAWAFGWVVSMVAACATVATVFVSATSADLQFVLRQSAPRVAGRGRLRDGLTVLQLGVTVIVLAVAGLLLHGFTRLMRSDAG